MPGAPLFLVTGGCVFIPTVIGELSGAVQFSSAVHGQKRS